MKLPCVELLAMVLIVIGGRQIQFPVTRELTDDDYKKASRK